MEKEIPGSFDFLRLSKFQVDFYIKVLLIYFYSSCDTCFMNCVALKSSLQAYKMCLSYFPFI